MCSFLNTTHFGLHINWLECVLHKENVFFPQKQTSQMRFGHFGIKHDCWDHILELSVLKANAVCRFRANDSLCLVCKLPLHSNQCCLSLVEHNLLWNERQIVFSPHQRWSFRAYHNFGVNSDNLAHKNKPTHSLVLAKNRTVFKSLCLFIPP